MKRYQYKRAVILLESLFLLTLTGCVVVNPCGIGRLDESASESFEFEIDIKTQNSFRIYGINGSIDITGRPDCTSVEIWGKKTVKSESLVDAETCLDDLRVLVSSSQNELTVRTEQPENSQQRSYNVVYHIIIPDTWQVRTENTNGEIEVNSVQNDVSINLTNGNITISDIVGNLNAVVTNGNIILSNIMGSTDANVTNGQIAGDVTLPLQGNCQMRTVNGQISLKIPKSSSAGFSAKVTIGDIYISDLIFNTITKTKKLITGTLGDGDGTIALKVTIGQINVEGF